MSDISTTACTSGHQFALENIGAKANQGKACGVSTGLMHSTWQPQVLFMEKACSILTIAVPRLSDFLGHSHGVPSRVRASSIQHVSTGWA